jgi:hypothetical protein
LRCRRSARRRRPRRKVDEGVVVEEKFQGREERKETLLKLSVASPTFRGER